MCRQVLYLRNHHNVRRKDARVHVDRVAVPLHVVLQHPSELRDARVADRRREARVPARAGRAQRLRRRLGHVPQLLRRQQLARARVLRAQLVDEQAARAVLVCTHRQRTHARIRVTIQQHRSSSNSAQIHPLNEQRAVAGVRASARGHARGDRNRHATLHEMIINCAAMYMVPHLMAPVPPSAPRGIMYTHTMCTHAFIHVFVCKVKDTPLIQILISIVFTSSRIIHTRAYRNVIYA